MAKTACDHIIEKARLIDAGIELLQIANGDLESYGFGGQYQKVGNACVEMYRAIKAVEPNMPFPELPALQNYMRKHSR